MALSLAELIQKRQGEQYALHRQYLNASLARVQAIIGFDKIYSRGEGAYLWDAEGNRYLDLLSGYSVFNLGREPPRGQAGRCKRSWRWTGPTWSRWIARCWPACWPKSLVKRMPPGLDAVFFANSGADAVDTALKFARAATRRPRVLYLDHAFHGLTLGTLSRQRRAAVPQGFRAADARL